MIFPWVIMPAYCRSFNRKEIAIGVFEGNLDTQKSLVEYHDLKNIIIESEFKAKITSSSKTNDAYIKDKKGKYGLFYGGGKDSLLSAALHEEFYGAENTTLFRLVWDEKLENLEIKRNMMKGVSEFLIDKGFNFKFVESDFHSRAMNRTVGKQADLALYPGLMAPLIKKYEYKQLSFGYDATEYHNGLDGNTVPFRRSRPEVLINLTAAMRDTFGSNITFKNFNFAFPPTTAFELLKKRYPEYLKNIYMCERLAGKWCCKCRKCFTYALYCLAYKWDKPDFIISRFFNQSIYIRKMIEEINGGWGYKYNKSISSIKHFPATLDLISNLDLEYVLKILSNKQYPNAIDNFMKIMKHFEGKKFPKHSKYWSAAYQYESRFMRNDEDGSIQEKMFSILNQHSVEICSDMTIEGMSGDEAVIYDFS